MKKLAIEYAKPICAVLEQLFWMILIKFTTQTPQAPNAYYLYVKTYITILYLYSYTLASKIIVLVKCVAQQWLKG